MTAAAFSVAEFLDFARSKPADEAYCYTSNGDCPIAQFLKDTGRCEKPSVGKTAWRSVDAFDWRYFDDRLDAEVAGANHTFGALVARLEALCCEAVL